MAFVEGGVPRRGLKSKSKSVGPIGFAGAGNHGIEKLSKGG
jgi:hypothetical protein